MPVTTHHCCPCRKGVRAPHDRPHHVHRGHPARQQGQATLDREGYGHALSGLAPLLADADLVIANHEGPVSADAPPDEKSYGARRPSRRCADPASLQALLDVGLRLVGLGNNHMLDHGVQGLADTVEALDASGIAHCGAGADDVLACRAVKLAVDGEAVVVASGMAPRAKYVEAGYYAAPGSPGPLLLDAGAVPPPAGTLRIVLAHWGPGYGPVDEQQRALAAELRGAGADLVVGTHPHTAQSVDVTSGAPVLFSVGNGAYPVDMARSAPCRAIPRSSHGQMIKGSSAEALEPSSDLHILVAGAGFEPATSGL